MTYAVRRAEISDHRFHSGAKRAVSARVKDDPIVTEQVTSVAPSFGIKVQRTRLSIENGSAIRAKLPDRGHRMRRKLAA